MTSSVGNVVTGCAAIRAGLVRPMPIVGAALRDHETGEEVPVVGHPIHGVTEGFTFVGLWLRIAEQTVADLIGYGRLPDAGDRAFWQSCDMILVLPALDPKRFPLLEEEPDTSFLQTSYADVLLDLCRLPIDVARVQVIPAGHVGAARALEMAAKRVDARQAERCLVVAVDSYLDADALDWLDHHLRLKHSNHPVGLMPGEAGAAFLLESPAAARTRGAEVDAWVRGVSIGDTGTTYRDDKPHDGIACADVISAVLDPDVPFEGDVITDLNGEEWRAMEIGGVFARLGLRMARAGLSVPAISLGDSGAASGAVGVCIAGRSYRRDYARSRQSLVVSLDDQGGISAIRLDRDPVASDGSRRKRG